MNSAYTKTTNPVKFVSESEVIHASDNTKETTKLLQALGFRMPNTRQPSGYNGSITELGRKINIQGAPFADVFSVEGAESKKQFSLSEEYKGVSEQLNESLPEIMDMESVSDVKIDGRRILYTGDRKTDEKAAQNVFKNQGLTAYRKELGNIDLSRKEINHSIYHGNNAAKQAEFSAVKDVIEKGRYIHIDDSHKGKNFDTHTFAAPVTMGTEKIGMAVVVKQAGNGARPGYYVHEICDSKGNYVDLDTNGNVIKNRPPLTCYPLQARLPICRRINLL